MLIYRIDCILSWFILFYICILWKIKRIMYFAFWQMEHISSYICAKIFSCDFVSIQFGTMDIPSIRLILWLFVCVYIKHMDAFKLHECKIFKSNGIFSIKFSISLQSKWIQTKIPKWKNKSELMLNSAHIPICKYEAIFIWIIKLNPPHGPYSSVMKHWYFCAYKLYAYCLISILLAYVFYL